MLSTTNDDTTTTTITTASITIAIVLIKIFFFMCVKQQCFCDIKKAAFFVFGAFLLDCAQFFEGL